MRRNTNQRTSTKSRYLIISQYFPPERADIPLQVARELDSDPGRSLTITGFPNYPAGRIYEGYREEWGTKQVVEGQRVLRYPLYIDHSSSAARRMLSYLSFGISTAVGGWRAARGADAVYVYATQMTAAIGPWVWRHLGGPPYVLHIQDLWPDSILGSGMVEESPVIKMATKVLSKWMSDVYGQASAVVAIAPTMAKTLASRGVDREKIHTVFNAADAPEQISIRRDLHEAEAIRVIYAGNVGIMQDLDTVLDAMKAVGKPLQLTIVGNGTELTHLSQRVAVEGISNVEFHDTAQGSALEELYGEADFALVPLRDLPAFRGTIPSKFQAAVARGIPVVTTVSGDLAEIVEHELIGFTAGPGSAQALADALQKAARTSPQEREGMRERARGLYDREFTWERSAGCVAELVRKAARQSRKRMHA